MLVICTYCSSGKHYSETPLPAIDLYKSRRITKVFETAKKSNVTFLILSGKYGLLNSNEEIDYYDHLLVQPEVKDHSDLIASQIKSKGISQIEFYMNSVESDSNLKAYIDCISIACTKASITLKINIEDFED
jgi:hypothetical protein